VQPGGRRGEARAWPVSGAITMEPMATQPQRSEIGAALKYPGGEPHRESGADCPGSVRVVPGRRVHVHRQSQLATRPAPGGPPGAERDAYGLRATPKRGRAAWLRSGGRAYGPRLDKDAAIAGRDDGAERGLYFLCLQSSIARGFEFIQQTWLANPGFLGLHGELDPIVGMSNGRGHITIPAEPFRLRLTSVPTVVTNRGGGYFFVPSLSALARIAAGPRH
jgi:hypothetical protein